jgi:hypothetical protein
MHLDIRIPIGYSFVVLGGLLAAFGIASHFNIGADRAIYDQHSLGINVNLWWGLIMVAFGAFMLVLSRRGASAALPTDESPEGRKLEETEKRREENAKRQPGGH